MGCSTTITTAFSSTACSKRRKMTIHCSALQESLLLRIPTELRLQIYDYCIEDASSITITAAQAAQLKHAPAPEIASVVAVNDICESLLGLIDKELDDWSCTTPMPTPMPSLPAVQAYKIPGLPATHVPVVRHGYDRALLSLTSPPTLTTDNTRTHEPCYAPLSLLQTCRQIYDELSDHMRRRPLAKTGLSLYVSYPYGVLVLQKQCPELLKLAKNVYITGYYSPAESNDSVPGRVTTPAKNQLDLIMESMARSRTMPDSSHIRLRMDPALLQRQPSPFAHLEPFPTSTAALAPAALALMVRTILSPSPSLHLQNLEARFFYPDETRYKDIWGDDHSPIVKVLHNICGGKLDMRTSRGRLGNAVVLKAKPKPMGRVLSNHWGKLGATGHDVDNLLIGDGWGVE